MKRLNFLLESSGAYATILSTKLAKQQEEARERSAQLDATAATAVEQPTKMPTRTLPARRGRSKRAAATAANASLKKRKTTDADYQLTDYIEEVHIYIHTCQTAQDDFILNFIGRMSKSKSSLMAVSAEPLFRNNPKLKKS